MGRKVKQVNLDGEQYNTLKNVGEKREGRTEIITEGTSNSFVFSREFTERDF